MDIIIGRYVYVVYVLRVKVRAFQPSREGEYAARTRRFVFQLVYIVTLSRFYIVTNLLNIYSSALPAPKLLQCLLLHKRYKVESEINFLPG